MELAFFFSCTSQGHNALPRPGLEPMSSGLEPSALTTGLLNQAVALACLRYSWLRVLKVAPCTLYTVIQSYSHMVIRLYGHTSKFFQLDGLLLFCIIMGLRSASSAKIVSVRELTGNTGTTSMWLFNMMDGKSGSFPFQVMTTATTLPDSAFYKINEKQN